MKKISIIIVLAMTMGAVATFAQQKEHRHTFDVEKHHQEQADYYAKELNLTDEERKAFIPLMEEYIHARFELNREVRVAGRELMKKETKTSADYQKVIDLGLDVRIKEATLQKEYYQKFGKVLPAEKVLKYHRAEKKFMQRAVRHHRGERGDARQPERRRK